MPTKSMNCFRSLGFKELRVPERGGVPSELLRVIEQKEAEVIQEDRITQGLKSSP